MKSFTLLSSILIICIGIFIYMTLNKKDSLISGTKAKTENIANGVDSTSVQKIEEDEE